MARAGILYSHVAAAAAGLAADNKNPTVDTVREALGGTGSKSTIAPMLKRWKEEHQQAPSPAAPGVPPSLLQAVKGVYESIKTDFQQNLDVEKLAHAAGLEQLADELQQSRAQQAALEQRVKALEAELDSANTTIAQAHQANHLLTVDLAGARSEQAGLQQRLADRASEVASLNAQLTQARAQFDHYHAASAIQRAEERQGFEQRAALVDRELVTLRQQLLHHKGQAAQLAGQLTQAGAENARLHQAAEVAQGEAVRARSESERAAFQLAALSAQLDRLQARHDAMQADLSDSKITLAVRARESEIAAARLAAAESEAHAGAQEKQALMRQLTVLETELRQERDLARERKDDEGKREK
ncbi:DNA-binding protein [Massilia sp. P8910]|uniref:DNA-binding protein n=1 Tax=Massilia antarctica TaxID=2765360 RepID=UPI001E490E14|nr:DNA-binding protein [Massilia antarctica]MCE3608231.1 DNA-binding protein [Massilia antarctica]